MKKTIKKIKQNLIGFILGAVIFSMIGVYAATQIASSNVTYRKSGTTTDITVNDALNEIFSIMKKPICKRATSLHTEKCNSSNSEGCRAAGYAANATITYGRLGTSGTLTSGDAFDCDVDGTGYNHRFYFVSYKYIGGTTGYEAYDTNTAVLIYYNNVSGGVANITSTYVYNSENTNYKGPISLVSQLPKTNQWSRLKSTKRTILNEVGGNTSNNGSNTLPGNGKVAYDYSSYAARLLTYQEIVSGCGSGTSTTTGYLDNCKYLMESTSYIKSGYTCGYWLETPENKSLESVCRVASVERRLSIWNASQDSLYGVRPAIDVSITDIKY